MAYLKQALEPNEVKSLTVANVKKKYNELAIDYNKLINLDYVYCPCCGDFKAKSNFYASTKSKSGLNHAGCKSCLLEMATDLVDKKVNERKDNRDKAIETLRLMDLPFIEETYQAQVNSLADNVNEKQRGTAWSQYIVMIQSLPNWRGKTFKDSEFSIDDLDNNTAEETRIIQKTIKSAKKRFGNGYSNEDYMFLENEYQDWTTRYPCETKSQEILFKRVCCKELEIDQASKSGRDTKDLDKGLQDLLASLGIKPSQSNDNALVDSQTFGQLIAKWEDEKPIPEPSPEFQDVDKIGLYIDVFFKGHLSKMMGLKNGFSNLYEKYIKKYTVTKPQYDEDTDSEELFNQIFGSSIDEDE